MRHHRLTLRSSAQQLRRVVQAEGATSRQAKPLRALRRYRPCLSTMMMMKRMTLFFKIRLMKHFSEATFKLSDLLPKGVQIPGGLNELQFVIPSDIKPPRRLNEMGTSKIWAFIGPSNSGADSVILLKQKGESAEDIPLIIESKARLEPRAVTMNSILEKKKHVQEQYPWGSTSIFLYMTDEKLKEKDISEYNACQGSDPEVRKLIVWDSKALDEGPLHALAALRHYGYMGTT